MSEGDGAESYQTTPRRAVVRVIDPDGKTFDREYPNVVIRPSGWVEYGWDGSEDRFAIPPRRVVSIMWSDDLEESDD